MKGIFLVPLVILLVGAFALAGCAKPAPAPPPTPPAPPPEKPIELKFAYWPPPADPFVQRGIESWGPEIEKKTNGRVHITYYGGEALGKAPDHYDLVLTGTADIAWINPSFTPGVFPLSDVRNLPFLYPSALVGSQVFWEQQKKYLSDTEFSKVKPLWAWATPVMNLQTRTKQVKKLEELKGMTFACTEAWVAKGTEALGGAAMTMGEPEIYTALERGMVDARWQEWHGLIVWKCGEVTKYRTVGLSIAVHQNDIIMNRDVWNSLPADVQKVFDETSMPQSRLCGEVFMDLEADAREVILAYDKEVGNPPPYELPAAEKERWIKAVQSVYDEWLQSMEAKGLPGQALLEDTRKWVEEYAS